MDVNEIAARVPGAHGLVEWFGRWPSFHDAEVVSIELNRTGASRVKVHAFSMTSEVDSKGHYVTEKHVLISFLLHDVSNVDLCCFNHQNVISGLDLQKTADGYDLILEPCYGVEGHIVAAQIAIEFEPGIPEQSVYAER